MWRKHSWLRSLCIVARKRRVGGRKKLNLLCISFFSSKTNIRIRTTVRLKKNVNNGPITFRLHAITVSAFALRKKNPGWLIWIRFHACHTQESIVLLSLLIYAFPDYWVSQKHEHTSFPLRWELLQGATAAAAALVLFSRRCGASRRARDNALAPHIIDTHFSSSPVKRSYVVKDGISGLVLFTYFLPVAVIHCFQTIPMSRQKRKAQNCVVW